MRILICDDEPLIIDQIQNFIKKYFSSIRIKAPSIAFFTDGNALLADKGDKDIIFLDIEMPGMNGLYVGNELKKTNHNAIIFIVTNYSEYLDEAMRLQVFRYLSKPLDKQRFFRNLKDAIDLYNTNSIKIPIETKSSVHLIPATAIIAIEAQGKKVYIHTISNVFESIHNMQYWTELLPKNLFFQTHRSFIVNFGHISEFDHYLIHFSKYQLDAYLTKRKYTPFKEAYLLYLESLR